ncbi:MAG TPA: hypothetical protein VGI44_17365 [Acidimicrobiales bacterium]
MSWGFIASVKQNPISDDCDALVHAKSITGRELQETPMPRFVAGSPQLMVIFPELVQNGGKTRMPQV